MPTFESHESIDIDIDVDEFYDEMSNSEKEDMAEMLNDDGFCDKMYKEIRYESENSFVYLDKIPGYTSKKFKKALLKLVENYSSLNKSTIEAIIALAD